MEGDQYQGLAGRWRGGGGRGGLVGEGGARGGEREGEREQARPDQPARPS